MFNQSIKCFLCGITIANFILTSASAKRSDYKIFTKQGKTNNHQQVKLSELGSYFQSSSVIFAENSTQVTHIRTGIITKLIKGVFKGTKVYLYQFYMSLHITVVE